MPYDRIQRIAEAIAPLRVEPGRRVRLDKDYDPRYKAGIVKKKDGGQLLQTGVELLAEYQARLAAQDVHAVLVCLQALDAGGKDGTIRHVMSGVNPQGVHVSSFKAPSAEELDHDYLWRYARKLPAPTSASSTGPTTRRCSSSGSTRRSSTGRSSRPTRAATASGSAATARSMTGSAT